MEKVPYIMQPVKCSNCGRIHELPVGVEGYGAGHDVTIECGACGKTFDAILAGPYVGESTPRRA
jgi:DNA-directed RNA polymerase subunit RPC12/RpoP